MKKKFVATLAILVASALSSACTSATTDDTPSTFESDAGGGDVPDGMAQLVPAPSIDAGDASDAAECSKTGLPSKPPETCTIAGTYEVIRTPRCPNACAVAETSEIRTLSVALGKVTFDDGLTCMLAGCGCTTTAGDRYVFMRDYFLATSKRSTPGGCTAEFVVRGVLQ